MGRGAGCSPAHRHWQWIGRCCAASGGSHTWRRVWPAATSGSVRLCIRLSMNRRTGTANTPPPNRGFTNFSTFSCAFLRHRFATLPTIEMALLMRVLVGVRVGDGAGDSTTTHPRKDCPPRCGAVGVPQGIGSAHTRTHAPARAHTRTRTRYLRARICEPHPPGVKLHT